MNEEKKYLTLEEAEKIVDDMYQKRWEECGVDDGNIIHMGNLDKLQYNELEKASILLLRTELRLQQENQQLKEQLEASEKAREEAIEFIKPLKTEKPYGIITNEFKKRMLYILNTYKGE